MRILISVDLPAPFSPTRRGPTAFDRAGAARPVYSIDTPPPTVSGSLHVGHVFSYTHADVARYQRMRARTVFYPMGWDDNGLPTERRVQNYFRVRCDPSLPYEPTFEPPEKPGKQPVRVSRPNFIELCLRLTVEDEKAFEALWRQPRPLGRLVDEVLDHRRAVPRVAQLCSCDLLAGRWPTSSRRRRCGTSTSGRRSRRPSSRTASAGGFHGMRFADAGDGVRDRDRRRRGPSCSPACVGVVAHPDDERYQALFGSGTSRRSSASGADLREPLADPEKGPASLMVCTFGDSTDVTGGAS